MTVLVSNSVGERIIGGVDVVAIDPRDQTWELPSPSFRVYFHEASGVSDEFQISGGDVDEVIAWADRERGAGGYVLYACVPRDGLGLVRLSGRDPHSAELASPMSG